MSTEDRFDDRNDYLKRLPPEFYQGTSYVHWSMTIGNRKTGWLSPVLHYKFREILTHTVFRYALCCPIYCLMPDHVHLLGIGLLEGSDQQRAIKFLRRQVNSVLEELDARFQQQPHDHVLRDDERQPTAFENVVEYIARNPERAGLVGPDRFREYPYTGCLVPGYPELLLRQDDFWERFWKIHAYLRENGLIRTTADE